MNGVLVIDKPAGPTSHDVVSKIRTAVKTKKVGHTGTLDPAATGVLPLVLGSATKLARFLAGGTKTYHATVRLGVTTETLDSEGRVTGERPVDVTEAQVREAVTAFVGDVEQIPPMYSAKKIDGQKLYELARQGKEVAREPKKVRIHAIDVVSFSSPDLTLHVRCSTGTYVRVLAHDLGDRLGCGAHLHRLRRVASGPFRIEDAITLDEAVANPETARARLLTISQALSELPYVEVPRDIGRMLASGYQLTVADLRTLDVPEYAVGDVVVVRQEGGAEIAMSTAVVATADLARTRRDERALKTERVLSQR